MTAVIGILLLTLILLSLPRVPLEITALTTVTLLAATGALPPRDAFGGFVDPAVLFIFALLAFAQALVSSGAMWPLVRLVSAAARHGERTLLITTLACVALFSSVVSNTATTAAFLPAVTGAARRAGRSPSRVLLPLAFASMLGGTLFIPGTSTNVVASSAIAATGEPALGFAELFPVSFPVAVAGLALLVLLAPRLLKARVPADETIERRYRLDVKIPPGSRFAGESAERISELHEDVRPVGIVRRGSVLGVPAPGGIFEGDRLVVEIRRDSIGIIERSTDVRVHAPRPPEEGESKLVEASVPPGSPLVGRTLRELLFSERFGVGVYALHLAPTFRQRYAPKLADVPLTAGDVLLLRGSTKRLGYLSAERVLLLLDEVPTPPTSMRRGVLTSGLFALVLVAGAMGWAPEHVAALLGVLVVAATGLVPVRTLVRVDGRVLLVIGAMISLGRAVERSGLAHTVGAWAGDAGTWAGPMGVLVALMVVTVILSGPMSNQAAALVMIPVAMQSAVAMGLEPRSFAIAVTLAASFSFVTPLEPSCVMVFRPGRYTFLDFVRVGLPLTLVLLALLARGVFEAWPPTPR